jgi:hypothetical protein
MTIEVLAVDIASGKRGSLISCPIARALKRGFNVDRVEVYTDFAFIAGYYLVLPRVVVDFIRDYDRALLVRTIKFNVEELPC